MPQVRDRAKLEAAMEAAASKALAAQRRAVKSQLAKDVGLTAAFWAEQEARMADRLRAALADVYRRSHANFQSIHDIDGGDSSAASTVWATNYTKNLSGLLTLHSSNLLAKPTENNLQVRSIFRQAFGRDRARTIAITEVTQAWTDAETSLAIPLGLKPIWRAGAKACDQCRPKNGKKITGRGPPLHPRCDCHLDWL